MGGQCFLGCLLVKFRILLLSSDALAICVTKRGVSKSAPIYRDIAIGDQIIHVIFEAGESRMEWFSRQFGVQS